MQYREARLYAAAIKAAVQRRYMPPWKAVPGFGEFQHERRLTDREIQLIVYWVDSGALEGDPRHLPSPLEFPVGWRLGEPDLLLTPDTDYVPERGERDNLRCFSLPTNLPGDRFVSSIEIRPGAIEVVHHVSLAADYTGISASLGDPEDPQPGYDCFGGVGFTSEGYLGTWVPGTDPQELPAGLAYPLPTGSRIVMQVHYHLEDTRAANLTSTGQLGEPRVSEGARVYHDGEPHVSDRTRVGLYFSEEPSPQPLLTLFFEKSEFVIPAGEQRYVVRSSFRIHPSAKPTLFNVLPHMHLLGREIKLDLIPPQGDRKTLIHIDDWDFDWQFTYWFQEPISVPPGSELQLTAVYDNSEGNLRNPHRPPRDVRRGENATDEMALFMIGLILE